MNESPKTLKPINSLHGCYLQLFFTFFKKVMPLSIDEEKIKVNFEKRQSSIEHKQFDCKKSAGIRVVSCVWPPGEAPSHSIHWGRPPTKREEHTKNPHFFSTFLSQWFSKIGKMVFFQGVLFHFLNEWWISEEQVA